MNNIALNFLQISPSEFEIDFFIKELFSTNSKEFEDFYHIGIYNEEVGRHFKYAVSFEKEIGFTRETFPSSKNQDLTKAYLANELRKQLLKDDIETFEVGKKLYNRVYFPIKNHSEGTETIWLEPYFLKIEKKYGFLIDYKFSVDPNYKAKISGSVDKRILQLSGTLDSRGNSNRAFYHFKYDKMKTFIKKQFPNIYSFGDKFSFSSPIQFFELRTTSLQPKKYLFHKEKESHSSFNGIKQNRPYQLPDKKINFLFVFSEEDRDYAIKLLNGLKGKSSPTTFNGIEEMFKIPFDNDVIKGKKVMRLDSTSIEEVVSEIKLAQIEGVYYLPIIITKSKQDELLYYTIKHQLTRENIPCQIVTKELITNHNALKYSLGNIGLQIFAKAGGQPWKVKPAIQECLIIGIGQKWNTRTFEDESGKRIRKVDKYLAYSVLTDSSGLFKEIQLLSDSDNYDDYHEKLKDTLKTQILKAIEDGYKDIVIHTPYKISKRKVWDLLFEEITTNINISVLIINDKHKYFGFDMSKNALVPYEGTYISISHLESLIWFEGLQLNNAPFTKLIGSPIYINFWYANNPNLQADKAYQKKLLQDCINLSGANWRGFKAKQIPVSIFYCQQIAEFLKKFEEYKLENIEFENIKPWFL